MSEDNIYCDNCGDELKLNRDRKWYSRIPCNVASANAGESAVICKPCEDKLLPGYCDECRLYGHDICSLNDYECSCCNDTRRAMLEEAP